MALPQLFALADAEPLDTKVFLIERSAHLLPTTLRNSRIDTSIKVTQDAHMFYA